VGPPPITGLLLSLALRPLRSLESQKQPMADLARLMDALEAGRERPPNIVSKIVLVRTCRKDELIIGERVAIGQ
jgi:hypothetical protein